MHGMHGTCPRDGSGTKVFRFVMHLYCLFGGPGARFPGTQRRQRPGHRARRPGMRMPAGMQRESAHTPPTVCGRLFPPLPSLTRCTAPSSRHVEEKLEAFPRNSVGGYHGLSTKRLPSGPDQIAGSLGARGQSSPSWGSQKAPLELPTNPL